MKSRWERHMKKDVQLWNPLYKKEHDEKKSGTGQDDWVEAANDAYFEKYEKKFRFEEAAFILHGCSKFDPMLNKQVVDVDNLTEEQLAAMPINCVHVKVDGGSTAINNIGIAQGSSLQRPIGTKAAKLAEKKERDMEVKKKNVELFGSLSSNSIADLAEGQKKIAKALEHKNIIAMDKLALQRYKVDLQKYETQKRLLVQEYQMYRSEGLVELANETLNTLRSLVVPEMKSEPPSTIIHESSPVTDPTYDIPMENNKNPPAAAPEEDDDDEDNVNEDGDEDDVEDDDVFGDNNRATPFPIFNTEEERDAYFAECKAKDDEFIRSTSFEQAILEARAESRAEMEREEEEERQAELGRIAERKRNSAAIAKGRRDAALAEYIARGELSHDAAREASRQAARDAFAKLTGRKASENGE
jgi:hypothetical protein